jgi:hypothetical protein
MSLLINIDVPDAEIAMRFYTSAFGLKSAGASARTSSSCWAGRRRSTC